MKCEPLDEKINYFEKETVCEYCKQNTKTEVPMFLFTDVKKAFDLFWYYRANARRLKKDYPWAWDDWKNYLDNHKHKSISFTPFFVADRPASLRILSGVSIPQNKKIGLMSHANTTKNFRELFKNFPCVNPNSCSAIGDKSCPYQQDISKCIQGMQKRKSIIKIFDSGVFTKEGCGVPSYKELFEIYEDTNVDYGIIIDFLKEKNRTIESAEKAMNIYKKNRYSFQLLGVAQGKSKQEYIDCYKKLKEIGYETIGIGGMLKKREKSARFVTVRDESLLKEVLSSIRKLDRDGGIFALGCYSPKRHEIFTKHSVFGSDYKGWIFKYDGKSNKRGDKKAQKNRFSQVRQFIEGNILEKPQNWKKKKLLVVSCSKRKKRMKEPAYAINLYDGPLYRLLRKRVPNFENKNGLDILILSAKYGLIQPLDRISYYDQIMTADRANELRKNILNQYNSISSNKYYDDIMINLGSKYFSAFEPVLNSLSTKQIRILEGPIGIRLKDTKEWILS